MLTIRRLRLFQRHLRSLVWVWVRSPSSRHPPFTHYPFPLRSLVCGGQPSPHKPRLVVSHSTCPPLSSSPHAHSFVLGTVVINTHTSEHFFSPRYHEHIQQHARRVFASSFSTGPPGDRSALHCRRNAIATQSIGIISVQARGILPRPEEQSRTCGCQSGGVEDQPQCPGL
jgi:hypothetical protein